MKSFALLSVALLVAVVGVQGGSRRFARQTGWGAPAPAPGWGANPPLPAATEITEQGAAEAVGTGGAIAEHDAVITIVGSPDVPALLSISTGSGVGLYQSASNYQNSQINNDGSSSAYQGNTASNSGYAYDYLGGDAQGLTVDVQSNGWSAVEGEGAVGQADGLDHQGPALPPAPPAGSGWKKP